MNISPLNCLLLIILTLHYRAQSCPTSCQFEKLKNKLNLLQQNYEDLVNKVNTKSLLYS